MIALDLKQYVVSVALLPQTRSSTHSLFVLAQCCVDDAHVEEDLGRVRHLLELPQGLVELIVVVPP